MFVKKPGILIEHIQITFVDDGQVAYEIAPERNLTQSTVDLERVFASGKYGYPSVIMKT